MGTKESLLSELGFLDEANVVFDENPKAKDSDKKKQARNEEVQEVNLDKALLNAIDRMSDRAALAVMEAYRKIPESIKSTVKGVYDAMGSLGEVTSNEDVLVEVEKLKKACGKKYKGIYEKILKDVKKIVPKIQARIFSEEIE